MSTTADIAALERQLDAPDPCSRRAALAELAARASALCPPPAVTGDVNMHCHSFFSYHAAGWSPLRIAWESRKRGLLAAALCDFDVLDGLDEFLAAGRLLGLRAAVHLETRAYLAPFADVDINSPGEPGVTYSMGVGFYQTFPDGAPQAHTLAALRAGATRRNEELIARINARLPAIALDYRRDVLPLTPKGVATERHIIRAYAEAGRRAFPDPAARASFWAPLLKAPPEAVAALETDIPKFEEAVRGALAKRGGIGYQQPGLDAFPPIETFTAWVRSCGAIPAVTWLDGTSGGEADCPRLLDLLCGMGCATVALIPDRNWNIKNPEERAVKVARLDELVRESVARDLPLIIGTEMNKAGLPFADDLTGPVLARHAGVFRDGARFIVGHTLLGRYADMPCLGERARAAFPSLRVRNAFYTAVGALPPLTDEGADRLLSAGPDRAFEQLDRAVRHAVAP